MVLRQAQSPSRLNKPEEEFALPLQSHLVRVLKQGEVRRVGEQEGHAIDVRVLASTSMDLAAQVEEGSFNRELHEYLALHQVDVPPLRERPEDTRLLAQHFTQQIALEMGQKPALLSDEVVAHLQTYNFPGNTPGAYWSHLELLKAAR